MTAISGKPAGREDEEPLLSQTPEEQVKAHRQLVLELHSLVIAVGHSNVICFVHRQGTVWESTRTSWRPMLLIYKSRVSAEVWRAVCLGSGAGLLSGGASERGPCPCVWQEVGPLGCFVTGTPLLRLDKEAPSRSSRQSPTLPPLWLHRTWATVVSFPQTVTEGQRAQGAGL